jgi:Cytochrome C oxidase, cbb3-type, subunit III
MGRFLINILEFWEYSKNHFMFADYLACRCCKTLTNNMFRSIFCAVLLLILAFACENQTYQSGGRLYKTMCANCHMDSGEGLGALIPPLAGADYLGENREKLPCIIRHGLQDTIVVNGKTYAEHMAGMPGLSDIQVTNLLNYINTSWGNNNPVYSYEEVTALLTKCR